MSEQSRSNKQNRGYGVMLPNRAKNPHPSAPGQYGYLCCPMCAAQLKLSGWVKTSKKGTKYLNMKIEENKDVEQQTDHGEEGDQQQPEAANYF